MLTLAGTIGEKVKNERGRGAKNTFQFLTINKKSWGGKRLEKNFSSTCRSTHRDEQLKKIAERTSNTHRGWKEEKISIWRVKLMEYGEHKHQRDWQREWVSGSEADGWQGQKADWGESENDALFVLVIVHYSSIDFFYPTFARVALSRRFTRSSETLWLKWE